MAHFLGLQRKKGVQGHITRLAAGAYDRVALSAFFGRFPQAGIQFRPSGD
jgi:hypothetical protein